MVIFMFISNSKICKFLLLALVIISISANPNTTESKNIGENDPFEGANRNIFKFNENSCYLMLKSSDNNIILLINNSPNFILNFLSLSFLFSKFSLVIIFIFIFFGTSSSL